MEIDSGESREVAPETNCFAPFWEMGEGSAGYILWLQHVLDVSQLLPSPLRSVSASLVLGLHGRYRERYHVGPPPRLPFDFPAKPVRMLNWRTPSSRGDTPSFSPDSALF